MMKNGVKQVIVRFPPSPTGEIHIGNVRTLLFNYLFAKQNNGKIVFRFEDTDKERSKKEYEEPMLEALKNLGLSYGEGPYRQSERIEIYKKYLHLLVSSGLAYEDVENAQKTGKIIRLKNHEREIVWNDLVKGEIKINTHTFKERDEEGNFVGDNAADIIIARSIDDPIYHFTVVVDDWLMGVTHIIRGDDHVTSTPRQIMIFEAIQELQKMNLLTDEKEVIIPEFAHLATIIGEDKKKLSKRNGVTSLKRFFDLGYLKETMINYLALLGWNPGTEQEFFTLEELIKEFSLEKCQSSPAQFDFKKLDSMNSHYIKKMNDEEYLNKVINSYPEDSREGINSNLNKAKSIFLKIYKDRISKINDVYEASLRGENNMFYDFSWDEDFKSFEISKIKFKDQNEESAKENLKMVWDKIKDIDDNNWNSLNLKDKIWDWSESLGRGYVLHPLRTILSLKDKSPDPFIIMEIIGKEETLRRFNKFI